MDMSEFATQAARSVASRIGSPPGEIRDISDDPLPRIFRQWYGLFQTEIAGERYVLLVPRGGEKIPARRVVRHMEIAADWCEALPVLATPRMTEERAKKLMHGNARFVTPSRHIHLPEIATVLGAFDPPREPESHVRQSDAFSAEAQAMVLLHVFGRLPERTALEVLAGTLRIGTASVKAAAGELVAAGLCRRDGETVEFLLHGRELFDAAAGTLASPVLKTEHFVGRKPRDLPLAGDAALCAATMLLQLDVAAYAFHGHAFEAKAYGSVACDEEDADFRIEHWAYPPDLIGSGDAVDPLSLHIIFRDNPDERVSIAADELLEAVFQNPNAACEHPHP